MNELVLLAAGQSPPEIAKGDLAVFWDGQDVPQNCVSLPRVLSDRILEIRREHMTWAYETGLLKTGDQTFAEKFECGQKPSMWWTSLIYERHPKLSPQLYPLYKLRCLEELMVDRQMTSLSVFGANRALRKLLASLCRARGWQFKSLPGSPLELGGEKGLLAKLYGATPAPLRALIRFVHWQWKVRRLLPYSGGKLPPYPFENGLKPAAIATYFPNIDLSAAGRGEFLSRYWESLHKALNRQAHWERPHGPHFVHWLFIRFPSPDLTLKQCIELRDLFQKKGRDGLSFNYLEEFLTSTDICSAFCRWFKLVFKSFAYRRTFARACVFNGSKLNFWPLMKKQWAESMAGWRAFERSLQNLAFRRFTKITGQTRWTLFPLENCPWERMLTEASHDQGNKAYGAQHSIIRPTDFRYFDDSGTFITPQCAAFQPDVIGANGDAGLTQWLQNGMPPKRAAKLEALRYLYLANQPLQENAGQNLPPAPGEPVLESGQKRLLVLTSFFRDETDASLSLLGKCLDAGLLSGWKIAIKPHPYLPVEEWLQNRPQSQQAIIRIASGPIALELKSGIIAWAANSTTAALEAALRKMDLMVMLPVNDFDLCPIQGTPGLARVGNSGEVRDFLERPVAAQLAPGYLDLNSELAAWRKLLGLDFPRESA